MEKFRNWFPAWKEIAGLAYLDYLVIGGPIPGKIKPKFNRELVSLERLEITRFWGLGVDLGWLGFPRAPVGLGLWKELGQLGALVGRPQIWLNQKERGFVVPRRRGAFGTKNYFPKLVLGPFWAGKKKGPPLEVPEEKLGHFIFGFLGWAPVSQKELLFGFPWGFKASLKIGWFLRAL